MQEDFVGLRQGHRAGSWKTNNNYDCGILKILHYKFESILSFIPQ